MPTRCTAWRTGCEGCSPDRAAVLSHLKGQWDALSPIDEAIVYSVFWKHVPSISLNGVGDPMAIFRSVVDAVHAKAGVTNEYDGDSPRR